MIVLILVVLLILVVFLILVTLFREKRESFININYMDDINFRPFLFVNNIREKEKKIRIYYNFKPVNNLNPNYYNILIDLEPNDLNGHLPNWDIILSWRKNRDLFIFPGLFILNESHNYPLYKILTREKYKKDRFCCFCTSNCDEKYDGVNKRIQFFELLSKYKFVHSIGKCKNNTKMDEKYDYWIDNTIENYKRYKFVIVGENSIIDDYITEKIFTALCAGCIPIYIGSSNINKYVNEDCFINTANFSSYEDCVKYILKVDSDDILYNKYISEPIMDIENFYKLTPWYHGNSTFFNKITNKIPYINVIPYQSIRNIRNIGDPHKNIKIINLEKSHDRREYMLKQFSARKDLKFEFFPAIDGAEYKKIAKENYMIDFREFHNNESSWKDGELGCLLSHCDLIYTLANDDMNDYYCIFEDDMDITNMKFPIEYYVENAPKNWDIIFLSVNEEHCIHKSFPNLKYDDIEYYRLNENCMPGCMAYIIHRKIAKFIINFIFPFKMPIDNFMMELFKDFNIYLYLEKGEKVVNYDYSLLATTIHNTELN